MQSSLVRKGLVLAVIVLFVGASYIPIIGGDQSVLNNIQTKDNYKNNEEPKILFNESKNTYSDKELNCKPLFDRGTTLYVGGTEPNNYTKIQDAINDASDGYTVFVYNDSSPYYESIIIDKSINLIGEDRDTTVIAGGGGNVGLNGLAFDPTTDKLYGASHGSLYNIDIDFGNQSYIGDFNTGGMMIAISFDNIGNCYGVDIGTDSLYSIDTESGEASLIGSFGINLNYAQDCAYDRDNEIFYLSAYTLGADEKGVDDDRASGEISRSGGAATIGSSGNTAIGRYAIAMGHNTTANGWSSTAMGEGTTASGTASTAMGNNSIASSYFSIAMGWNAIANAYAATAIGPYTIASGNYSRAIGYGTTASGHEATAIGVNTTASGQYATTMGFGTTASGLWSTALGRYIIVEGDNSVGIGLDGSSRTVTPDNVMSIMGGNVGIGTTSPSYLLDVSGGDDIVAQFSGRVKGADAVNDDEFATKKQVDSVSISRFTPTGTSDSNGNVGDTAWDDNYYYVKTPDGWKRAALETWESPSLFTK